MTKTKESAITESNANAAKHPLLNAVTDWKSATGSEHPYFAERLLMQVCQSMFGVIPEAKDGGDACSIIMAVDAIRGIAPKNEVEGMLAAQMVSAHNAAMECMRRAMLAGQYPEAVAHNLKMSDRFMRTYTMQMEALNRNRGKGQQQIVVKHVSVNDGGQAVVGTVNHSQADPGARGDESEIRGQSHAIADA